MVARVQMRGERGLVLAAQDLGHTARKAPEHLVRGVDHKPISLQIGGFRRPGLLFAHSRLLSKSLPSMSGPRRGPFSAPGAGPALAFPLPPTPIAGARGPPLPARRRCCAPSLGGTLLPPAPARRS